MSVLLQLYAVFFKIALVTFGGGYAMIPLFQDELVVRHAALTGLTAPEFANMVALAQMTPGPIGLNAATYIGYQVGLHHFGAAWGGCLASAVSTFAIMSPSLVVTMLVAMFLRRFAQSRLLKAALGGIRPAVLGLIGAAVVFFADTSLFTAPLRSLWAGAAGAFAIRWGGIAIFALAILVKLLRPNLGILWILLGAAALGVAVG